MTTAWQTRGSPEPVWLTWYIPTLYMLHCRAVNFLFKKRNCIKIWWEMNSRYEKMFNNCHFSPSWPLFFKMGRATSSIFLHQAVLHCKKCCVKIIRKLNKAYLNFFQILEKYHFGYWPYLSPYISETVRATKNPLTPS